MPKWWNLTKIRRKVVRDTTAPSAPVLTATAGTSSVALSWTASTDANGVASYRLEYSADQSNWTTIYTSSGSPLTRAYSHTGLGEDDHYYRVSALDPTGNRSNYGTATATIDLTGPSTPVLTANVTGLNTISLSWTASTDASGVSGYILQRSPDNSTWATLQDSTTRTYSDSGLSASTLYYYRVRAYDPYSNYSGYGTASATTQSQSANLLETIEFDEGYAGIDSPAPADPRMRTSGNAPTIVSAVSQGFSARRGTNVMRSELNRSPAGINRWLTGTTYNVGNQVWDFPNADNWTVYQCATKGPGAAAQSPTITTGRTDGYVWTALSSANTYRTEIVLDSPGGGEFVKGVEYWMGLSVYLPADWSSNYVNGYSEGIVWQFHGRQYLNLAWRETLPIVCYHTASGWLLTNPSWTTTQRPSRGSYQQFNVTRPYIVGGWNDFVFNVIFSGSVSENDTTGKTHVWVNEFKAIEYNNTQNFFGEQTMGPYFKMGLYQWGFRPQYYTSWAGVSQRIIYHDGLRIGNASSSYAEVMP